MTFHDIRFPTAISFGSSGGPERKTEIVTLGSGYEERNAVWAHSRRRYDVGYGVKSLDDLHAVIAFFEARLGCLYGFRFKDFSDFRSGPPGVVPAPTDQALGAGDAATANFQLLKLYSSGPGAWTRRIVKPIAGSVRVSVDGIEQGSGWTVDTSTGIVTFTSPPAMDTVIAAGFEFDVPVRFDLDSLSINLDDFRAGEIPHIPLIEVRL